MRVIGIDPGMSGGIAIAGICEPEVWPMPPTERDIWDLIEHLTPPESSIVALIERVHAMPGQGVSSMFNFGRNYGFLRACLIASRIPFEDVRSVDWQRHFGLLRKSKDETNTQKKNRHKAKAQELFPMFKVNHKIADALLIASYGVRRQTGVAQS